MNRKKTERNFHLMVDATPTALLLIDSNRTISYVNRFAANLLMYSNEQLIGKDLAYFVSKKDLDRLAELFKKRTQNAAVSDIDDKGLDVLAFKGNGEGIQLTIKLNNIESKRTDLILATLVDNTDWQRVIEEFRLLIDAAPNAMILVNDTGIIELVNKQAEVLFGYNRRELLGVQMEVLLPQSVRGGHMKLRQSFNEKPQFRAMGEGRDLFALRKDGMEIPIEIGLNPIYRDKKKFVLASIIDITARKSNEEAFKKYTRAIEHKNQELEQFTFIASHDLREPLNSISGLIELILEENNHEFSESVITKLGFITQSAYRMRDLINGLLDYARLGKNSQLENVDFNEILNSVIHDLDSAIKTSESIVTIDLQPHLPAYEMEIRLLFQNLISNSIKYRRENIPARIHISTLEKEACWEFAIKDNGIGISLEYKDKIFMLFQRLHARNRYGGIGIGLAHCKKIVELHNGSIWVDSEIDSGSTFYFSIPK